MKKIIILWCLSWIYVSSAFAASTVGVVIPGVLEISTLVFPDGTRQASATVQGPQGIQGPQGNPGAQGIQGPPGPNITGKRLWNNWSYTNFIPAIGAIAAYTQTNMQTIYYDTTGKCSGWLQITQNGNATPITYVGYFTDYDAYNNSTKGYQVNSNSPNPIIFTQSYTYDSEGRRTQRVKTLYNNNNTVLQTITWNYDVDHHGALTSTISVIGNITTTVTYSNIYDANGYQSMATTTTSQFDSSTSTTTNWTGSAVFEFIFLPYV